MYYKQLRAGSEFGTLISEGKLTLLALVRVIDLEKKKTTLNLIPLAKSHVHSVGWGCRICRFRLCREGKIPHLVAVRGNP